MHDSACMKAGCGALGKALGDLLVVCLLCKRGHSKIQCESQLPALCGDIADRKGCAIDCRSNMATRL